MAPLVVTIDGPAASGKSTVARHLAERIGAAFLDTGAMYRAVTWAAQRDGVDLSDEAELARVIDGHAFAFEPDAEQLRALVDDVDVTDELRDPDLTAQVRHIAASPAMRARLVEMQRQFAGAHGRVVTEGRDQGTVAFPDAEVKFYLEAAPAERARRRQRQLQTQGRPADLGQLRAAIEARDRSDRERSVGPLRVADDAIVVDTTDLAIEDVVERLLQHIGERQK